MKPEVRLLIVDPQNDFCDLPVTWQSLDPLTGRRVAPALPVAGAHADLQRLAALIRAAKDSLSRIIVTFDSHHRFDIAHPTFWQRADGSTVAPFTPITAQQVRAGAFVPRAIDLLPRALAYLDELEARGRYTLMVWPVHCEIGSWGHDVHADVQAACGEWEAHRLRTVQPVFKGMNPWTEHYSAIQAEVPDPADPGTQLSRALLADLDGAELLLIAGQASSHCVKATVEDIVDHLPGGRVERLMLLTDCMSPVSGFEAQAEGFLAAMRGRGVRLGTSTDARALLGESD